MTAASCAGDQQAGCHLGYQGSSRCKKSQGVRCSSTMACLTSRLHLCRNLPRRLPLRQILCLCSHVRMRPCLCLRLCLHLHLPQRGSGLPCWGLGGQLARATWCLFRNSGSALLGPALLCYCLTAASASTAWCVGVSALLGPALLGLCLAAGSALAAWRFGII